VGNGSDWSKNDKFRSSLLLEKYDVHRVVDIDWSITVHPAKYQVVTQFIQTMNGDDFINAEQEN